MNNSMSAQFVRGFVETCHKQGLPAEAAAVLLEKESVDRAKSGRPDFACGYDDTMERFKASVITGGRLTKSGTSKLLSAAKSVWGGLGNAGKVTWSGLGNAGKATWSGYSKLGNPAKLAVGVGVGATGLWGGNKAVEYMMNRNKPLTIPVPNDVYADNAAMQDLYNRRAALQSKLDNYAGGGSDYDELHNINTRLKNIEAQRNEYLRSLTSRQETSSDMLKDVEEDIARTRDGGAWRWWFDGGEAGRQEALRRYYDKRQSLYQAQQGAADLNRRLVNQETGVRPPLPSPPPQTPQTYFRPL